MNDAMINHLATGVSLAISVFTFVLLLITRRNFHRLEFSVTQRQTVLDLIDALRASKTYYRAFKDNGNYLISGVSGIDPLELALHHAETEMDEYSVVDWSNSPHAHRYLLFIENPRLPRAIAEALRAFNTAGEIGLRQLKNIDSVGGTVVVGNSEFSGKEHAPGGELAHPLKAVAYKSWGTYQTSCRNLRQAIEGWMQKNKMAEVNL